MKFGLRRLFLVVSVTAVALSGIRLMPGPPALNAFFVLISVYWLLYLFLFSRD